MHIELALSKIPTWVFCFASLGRFVESACRSECERGHRMETGAHIHSRNIRLWKRWKTHFPFFGNPDRTFFVARKQWAEVLSFSNAKQMWRSVIDVSDTHSGNTVETQKHWKFSFKLRNVYFRLGKLPSSDRYHECALTRNTERQARQAEHKR